MKPLIKRPFGTVGFLILTIVGLVVIQFLYDRVMPAQLQIGELLAVSFVPFTYPLPYWLAHLLLVFVLLGSLAWAFGVRGITLFFYLGTAYFLSILGPLWLLLVQIYGFQAHH